MIFARRAWLFLGILFSGRDFLGSLECGGRVLPTVL